MYLLLFFLFSCYNLYIYHYKKEKFLAICAFFGHRNFPYKQYENKISDYIMELIKENGVTQFYSGFRGDFDRLCAEIVHKIKSAYPNIINTMVLSYYPNTDFILPSVFDDSVYLLEEKVPPRFAISYTNRKIVDLSDYIISGTILHTGGAAAACEYAASKSKIILSIF